MPKTDSHLPVSGVASARSSQPPPGHAGVAEGHAVAHPRHERDEHSLTFFATVAEHIARDMAPQSTLDVGCGTGLLVEALLERGVDAYGIDVALEPIDQVRPELSDRCRMGSALEPFGRLFDLITCIEVMEHLPASAAEGVVQNICTHTDDVVFASTPLDYREETHVNVNPPEHWAELFARFGFHRDLVSDLTYLAPWAMRFRRSRDPLPRLVRDYERELWRLRDEAQQRNEVILGQLAHIDALGGAAALAERERLRVENVRLSSELGTNQRLLIATSADLTNLRGSGAGKVVDVVQRSAQRVAPPGTRRQRSLHRMVRAAIVLRREGPSGLRKAIRDRDRGLVDTVQVQYDEWRARHEPTWEELNRMRHENLLWTKRPLVSIIMPTYNPQESWLRPAIDSVLGQVYENWELCIADDASTAPHVAHILGQYAAADPRIKVVRRDRNGGIAAASASALEVATGEFVGLLDHDDLLRPHALHRVVELLQTDPELDIVYSDEDMLQPDGTYGKPFFKPDWSPDFLLSVNYMCHFLVLRRELVERAGGFRGGFDGAQDHDLLLRTTERARHVGHVPDVLYAWRQVAGSVALAGDAKMYAYEAGLRAVEEALTRRGLSGQVTRAEDLGRYHVRLDVVGNPHVAIVIPTRDRVGLLRTCIDSIENLSTYANWSITIVDNDSVDPETLAYLEQTKYRVVRKPGHFNYSRLINLGRSQIEAPYMLTVNNDVTVISPDWIEALLEQVQRPEVGVAGGRLLYPDGRVQHEGIGLGNVRGGYIAANLDAWWMGRVIRNVSAVTGACQMVKVSVFDEVGGYDETLQVGFNDVDFCLRVHAAGYLIVYTPHAELSHPESASRGKALDPAADYQLFWSRWGVEGGIHDPYLSPHIRNLNPLQLRLGRLPNDR
jgi:GT2 family glycosyltransferase/SAM-dependent methyltransferase